MTPCTTSLICARHQSHMHCPTYQCTASQLGRLSMLMVMVHDDVTIEWAPPLAAFKLPMYQYALHGCHKQTRFISSFSWGTHISHTLICLVHSRQHCPCSDKTKDGLQSEQWDVHPKALSIMHKTCFLTSRQTEIQTQARSDAVQIECSP